MKIAAVDRVVTLIGLREFSNTIEMRKVIRSSPSGMDGG